VYVRFARWRDAGVWEQTAAWLIRHKRRLPHVRQRQVQLDSTSVRVHHQGTGAKKKPARKPSAAVVGATPPSCT
jgi:transposase